MSKYTEVIAGATMNELYPKALAKILALGIESSPREMKTKELLAQQVVLFNARANVVTSAARDLNYRFMLAEWLWIMAAKKDVESIARYNKQIAQFSDDGLIFNGAYGPRLSSQWKYVLDSLRKPDSRQAVATIWTPVPESSKDIPCTVCLQFLLRAGMLHAIVTMRSSDAWLGLPYDVFNFSMIQNGIAGALNVEVGTIVMQLGSFHLYDRNWAQAESVVLEHESPYLISPRLPAFPPADQMMVRALDEKWVPPYFGEPWDRYTHALSVKTKAECLNELRKLQ